MRKYLIIALILIGWGANGQTPTPAGYLNQTAKWKYVNYQWFSAGAYFNLSKAAGQTQYMVRDSATFLTYFDYLRANKLVGNLSINNFNSGSGATSSTFWRGDGTWATAGSGTVTGVAALTLGTSGTDLSSTVANGTTTPVITLNVPTASATNRGALSSTDWSTFNNKLSTAAAASTYLPLVGGTLTGNLLFTDNTYDIGASGLTRPRTGYFGTSIITPIGIFGTARNGSAIIGTNIAPTAAANYGLVSLGNGAFDGLTSGFFNGSANGTVIAGNISGSADLINMQKAGAAIFKVSNVGMTTTKELTVNNGGFERILFTNNSFISNSYGELEMRSRGGSGGFNGMLFNVQDAFNSTSGTQYGFANNLSLAFSAGSASFNVLKNQYTINNSGAQSGIITGLKIEATETNLNGISHDLINATVGGVSKFKVNNLGNTTATKYYVSSLNTAPSSASDTGTLGEIRFGSGYIYLCTATNTWVRTALTTW